VLLDKILTKTKILTNKSISNIFNNVKRKNSSQKIPPKKFLQKNFYHKKFLPQTFSKKSSQKFLPKISFQKIPPKKFLPKNSSKKATKKIPKQFPNNSKKVPNIPSKNP
jgi:hypothetical protein